MRKIILSALCALMIGAALNAVLFQAEAYANEKDKKEIQALANRFAAAYKAKDINAIMSGYIQDESLLVFDVVPPRQYAGAKAYRKDWEDLFAAFPGPVDFVISDMRIMTDGDLAFSHSIQHAVLTGADGSKVDITARVTDVYRRINGKWVVIHEHISVPVDLAANTPDLSSKP